jgi:hypothetical protein
VNGHGGLHLVTLTDARTWRSVLCRQCGHRLVGHVPRTWGTRIEYATYDGFVG